ncbi:MAG: DNA repair protein RecN [Desulfurivibrionaceae bacterium]|nr:DNA repair protein RecN [Desulfobulbales bacterium]MDT8334532.1 DNA repair protein RecN [Desulfurivibrionaceae bacterium]
MLRELKITNLALISSLRIELGEGLTVLTGETGAGKSIILQSINLLYGEKAAASWVRSGSDKAQVEALFECGDDAPVLEMLREQGFDSEDNLLIVKRIISAKGGSRYYLNGGLATGRLVGEVTENLISVASQHDHQQLLDSRFHLDFLDAYGGLMTKRSELGRLYDNWRAKRDQYRELKQREKDKDQRRDFLAFQCREIEEAAIVLGEDEALDLEKTRLRGVEDLRRLGGNSYGALTGQVTDVLAEVRGDLARMAELDKGLENLAEEVAGYGYQLEEAAGRLGDYLDNIFEDPERLDEITARIDLLQQLKRKYGPGLDDVLAFGGEAAAELRGLAEMDQALASLAEELESLAGELEKKGGELSAARLAVAERLAAAVGDELRLLCLENAGFDIDFGVRGEPSAETMSRKGWDRPEFIFSANPGEPLKPMAKVASGGELSRLMLALKCILARHDLVDTVIFDEIDAGISGKAAEAVARKIRELSEYHQVLCITHLPQIASCAKEHFTVAKKVSAERTHTTIERLSDVKRVAELAGMLDGESVTAGTLEYVRELLARNKR